jgi:hypothetical protein
LDAPADTSHGPTAVSVAQAARVASGLPPNAIGTQVSVEGRESRRSAVESSGQEGLHGLVKERSGRVPCLPRRVPCLQGTAVNTAIL